MKTRIAVEMVTMEGQVQTFLTIAPGAPQESIDHLLSPVARSRSLLCYWSSAGSEVSAEFVHPHTEPMYSPQQLASGFLGWGGAPPSSEVRRQKRPQEASKGGAPLYEREGAAALPLPLPVPLPWRRMGTASRYLHSSWPTRCACCERSICGPSRWGRGGVGGGR